jgi:hypothetical protein
MAALVQSTPQEALVADALATVSLPKGVRLLRFYFDSDWSGDPAVRVVYGVSKKIPLTKARVRDLVALMREAENAIDILHLDRFAYVTFDDVR